ncbi:ketoacyl-ACP synthase III [Paenibacillus sp. FSL R5-0519]|uniref:3-oxoacyl-ACP synthase III family protein n=1 Tax=Paenibacillus sp. FSL R5-0519 TaxID=2921648 RepID=UPI0030D7C052
MRQMTIRGIGMYVPESVLTNQGLEAMDINANAGWIYHNLGIRERRIAHEHEYTSDLGLKAARQAIEQAAIDVEDIDMIIMATFTPDRLIPHPSAIVKEKLGAGQAICLDLRAGCAGFSYGLMNAFYTFQAEEDISNILVIGADTYSKVTDWQDRAACSSVGDGAGAFVLQELDEHDSYHSVFLNGIMHHENMEDISYGTLPVHYGHISDGSVSVYTSNGRYLYEQLVRGIPRLVNRLLRKVKWNMGEVDLFIFPQTNSNLIRELAVALGIPQEKAYMTMEKYGYTSNACLPIAVAEAVNQGELKTGDRVVLVGAGAGTYYCATAIRWGEIV